MSHWIATLTPGLERPLLDEVKQRRPESRPGYRRPGLITFTEDGLSPETPLFPAGCAFAQQWGHSLGVIKDDAALAAAVAGAGLDELQVFSRPSGEDTDSDAVLDRVAYISRLLGAALPGLRQTAGARRNQPLLGVIVAPDEPTVLVRLARGNDWGPLPGGRWPIEAPADSPSRDWAKLDEALAWSRLPLKAGQRALVLGDVGGASRLNLLRRGLLVTGVDNHPLPPVLAEAGPGLTQLAQPMSQLRWESLTDPLDWLLMDVNLAPALALRGLRRLLPPLRKRLQGALLSLKLNDEAALAGVPKLIEQAAALGLGAARVRHLPSQRREFWVALGSRA